MATTHPFPTIDPSTHLSRDELAARYDALEPAPKGSGHVTLLLARGPDHSRIVYERVLLTKDGMPGDRWQPKAEGVDDDQLAVMGHRVTELIANGQSQTLFGDNIALDMDLSEEALPIGSRVRLGDAVFEVTPKPHTGCSYYAERFGADALRFTREPERRAQHLRGIYLRVVEPGEVWLGAPATLLA